MEDEQFNFEVEKTELLKSIKANTKRAADSAQASANYLGFFVIIFTVSAVMAIVYTVANLGV